MELVRATATDTLASIAYEYLGDFEKWIDIADFNDLDPFSVLTNLEIAIPDESFISNISQGSEFIDLSVTLKTINNWKSLRWV